MFRVGDTVICKDPSGNGSYKHGWKGHMAKPFVVKEINMSHNNGEGYVRDSSRWATAFNEVKLYKKPVFIIQSRR